MIATERDNAGKEEVFAAVSCRSHWFWTDDRDSDSKGAFTFLMVMFSFTEKAGGDF